MDAEHRAALFERVREAHRTETAEDYCELIDDLIKSHGEARPVDLSAYLGVTQATVNKTVARLQRDGLVTSRPYRSIFLTEEGRAMADASRKRHQIVYNFLLAIGVDPETAKFDSEGLEHHVSRETLDCFKRIIAERKHNSAAE